MAEKGKKQVWVQESEPQGRPNSSLSQATGSSETKMIHQAVLGWTEVTEPFHILSP